MRTGLLTQEVLPFYARLALLGAATLALDAVLHGVDQVWIGRYLGIPGVLLIIGSFGYSLRKHKLIASGNPATLLRLHEYMAWTGSLLVLVHAGIHFNALLPWLAIVAMLVNVASGLTGKFLVQRARKSLQANSVLLRARGMAAAEIAETLHWDSVAVEAVKQWRVVHYPITLAFAVLALGHIVSIFLFWGWR